MLNNRKRRPTHPDKILREDVLPAAGLTQDKLARLLGVSRRTVSEILHERRPFTTDMAHRLARAFGTSPEMWLGLQQVRAFIFANAAQHVFFSGCEIAELCYSARTPPKKKRADL